VTQTADPTLTPPAPPRKGLKLPPALVIPIIALLIAGAAWLVYKQVFAAPVVDLSMYESPDSPAAQLRRKLQTRSDDPKAGIGMLARDNGADVRLPGAQARFVKQNNQWTLDPSFQDRSFIPAIDLAARFARGIAVTNKDAAARANVTDEQVEKLKKVTFPPMVISDADKKTLLDQFAKWQAADAAGKPKADAELTDTFRRVASDAIVPTQKATAAAAKEVRAILTSEQINNLRPQNNNNGNRARPARTRNG
jgi:hypothetical protein